jgi:putative iron-dependent peroxidase
MPTPQHGIFAIGTRSHHHLQLDVAADAAEEPLMAALRSLREQATSVAGVNIVVGLGADLARRITPEWVPEGLTAFTPIDGGGVSFPADQHDLWIWLHGASPDGVFDVARRAAACLAGLAEVVTEQPCFTYQASLDLTGFEDGTENPPLDEAADAAVVPDGAPGAGASVVLLQRWVHDLDGFGELDDVDQGQVFGRDKHTNTELPDDVRSPRSHISRVVIDDADGAELEVFRRSTTFGGVLEHGLQFLAFASDVARLDRMLRRMVGEDDGVTDALTDFSTSTGGGWYVAPPVEAFAEPG